MPIHPSNICTVCARVITPSNDSVEPISGRPDIRLHRECYEYFDASEAHVERLVKHGAATEPVDAWRDLVAQAERSLALAEALRADLADEWHFRMTQRALSLVHQMQAHDAALERTLTHYPLLAECA